MINNKITDKIILQNDWKTFRKEQNKKIVFTNGCFDLLHRGHIEYLFEASLLGNCFVIGLNTDKSIRQIKGETRPLQDEYSRAIILASLFFTDFIMLFDETTPYNLIDFVKPDILVKGADYSKENIVGADIVEGNGGIVKTIKFIEGYSTSKIIEKIKIL